MSVWFTSDTHFFHRNIIAHSSRPFETVEEMNEKLISNWNRVVRPDDHVYLLGDVSFGSKNKTAPLLARLHGKIYLIRGNHDHDVLKSGCVERFEWVKDIYDLKVPDPDCTDPKQGGYQTIVLCHFPLLVWNNIHHGAYHLHGHSHGTLAIDMSKKRHDVGVDNNFLAPISYDRVKQIMANRKFIPIDQHGRYTKDV